MPRVKKSEETTVKTTTKPKASKPKTTKKVEDSQPQNMTINDIPQELLAQLTAQIMQNINSTINKTTTENKPTTIVTEEPIIWNKASLSKVKQDVVEVRSVIGDCTFKNTRTGIEYKWYQDGDVEALTIEDILTMESTSKRFLHTPWLMVDDERIIKAFDLEGMYKVVKEVENIDSFLENDISYIKETISKLPHDFKRQFKLKIIKMINNREIRDYVIVEELRDILGLRE